jgi:hypothetical protein
MRRVRCNYRELELRLGSSISIHCLSSYGCQMTDHPKRPKDANQLAKSIIDIATEKKPDRSLKGASTHGGKISTPLGIIQTDDA